MDPNLIISICVIVGLVLLRILLPVIVDWSEPKPGKQRGILQKFLSMAFIGLGGSLWVILILIPVFLVLCILYSAWEALLNLFKN